MAERPTPVPRGTPPAAPVAQQAAPAEPVAKPKGPVLHRVQVDLGSSTDHMRINDVEYYHGQVYMIPDHMLASFNEIMHNTKMHEEVVKGYRSPTGSSKGATRRV